MAPSRPNPGLIYAVFRHGLRLKERLRLGRFNISQEQAELKRLVKNAESSSPPESGDSPDRYLGVTYPLACWLDELFIMDPASPWKLEWNENKLETSLENFRSNDRAWKFWTQAAQAEARGDEIALEAFYLSMMLGFRGSLRDDPNSLEEWRERLEAHLPQPRADAWSDMPIEKPIPPPNVPPRRGRERLRLLFIVSGLVVASLIVALVYTMTSKALNP